MCAKQTQSRIIVATSALGKKYARRYNGVKPEETERRAKHILNRGIPAPDDPRRCKGKSRRRFGEQCPKFAMRGSNYCRHHGGAFIRKQQTEPATLGDGLQSTMPRFYSKHLGKTLAAAIAEQEACGPDEQLQLYEELQLMRDVAGQAVQMYSVAREAIAQCDPSDTKKFNALQVVAINAGTLMQEQLARVVSIVETAARMRALAKDNYSPQQLHFVVNQLVRITAEVFDNDVDKARLLDDAIKKHLKLPSLGTDGTNLTPDMDVQAMDATIPAI